MAPKCGVNRSSLKVLIAKGKNRLQDMALKITSDCINCDICEPECPNEAISYDNKVQKTYVINPDLCTECIGFYDEPTCDKVCPIDCIIKDDERTESPEQLLAKYKQIWQK